MRNTKKFFVAALVGLGLTTAANAAQIITGLSLLDATTLDPLPNTGGVYTMSPGQIFKVQFEVNVPDPNTLRTTGRTAAQQAGASVGVQTINANIISGANNVVVPLGDSNSPPHWTADGGDFVDATAHGLGFPFATLNAVGDPDLDVTGAGFVNTSFTVASAAGLNGKQYGVNEFTAISLGDYMVSANPDSPLTTLFTQVDSAKVYADSASGTGVVAVDPTSITNGSVTIQVPEPASLGLLSIGALALGRRRRNA